MVGLGPGSDLLWPLGKLLSLGLSCSISTVRGSLRLPALTPQDAGSLEGRLEGKQG